MDDAASRLAELEEDDVGADRSDESDGVARAVPRDVCGSEEVNLADADGGAVDVEDPVVRQAVEVVDGGAVVAIILGRGVVRDVTHVPVAVRVEGVRVEGIVQRVRARGGIEVAQVIAGVVPFVAGLGRAGRRRLHGPPPPLPPPGWARAGNDIGQELLRTPPRIWKLSRADHGKVPVDGARSGPSACVMTIPVNIITGVLGVGKTTAIRHLISQRPANERWAIVVNEFGALGIDGAILDTAGGLSKGDGGGSSKGDGGIIVREVAGGCLCCAVAAPFTVAVTQLLRRAKPDRLIIEPSGMGHPGGLHDALQDEHLGKVLRIAATIALVDMTQVARGGALVESEAFRDQVQCADVVVGAKGDVATVADQCRFTDWAQTLYPPKLAVHVIARGELRLDVLNTPLDTSGGGSVVCKPTRTSSHAQLATRLAGTRLAATRPPANESDGADADESNGASPGYPVRVVGGTDAFATFGLLFHRDDVFLRSSLAAAFGSLAKAAPAVVRFKGVVRVGAKEWVAPRVDQAASGTVRLDPVAWRRDSRIEVIVDVGGRKVGFVDGEGTDGEDRGGGGEEATGEAGEEDQGEEADEGEEEDQGEGAAGIEEAAAGDGDGHLAGIEEEDEEGYGSDGRDALADAGVSADAAGPAAARRDWDAFTAAIVAAIKPNVQSPKKSPNAKRIPGLEDA